ncbi:MAG: tRNA pseudouridine(38-40) synthase TruA [Gammaproteobacteria bacterium]|nr:tRNA pseudouridine(38-40) synthase TruA [Gammaproteobacteria bacterium]
MRIALIVEYDGSQYHGWQSQPGLRTVQGVLEQALTQVANHEVRVVYSGRTDTGVHATHQVVHFDVDGTRNIRAWVHGANALLPKDVCVKWGQEIADDFHARYSAVARRYRYVIYNAAIRQSLLQGNVTWQSRRLDHNLMQEAAQCLLGKHDFTSFRAVQCGAETPVREIQKIEVFRRGDLVILDIKANAFLHHMVRNIAGVLMAVGQGRQEVAWVDEVLRAKDRKRGAETAPPYGLYLVDVTYPGKFKLASLMVGPWFLGPLEA